MYWRVSARAAWRSKTTHSRLSLRTPPKRLRKEALPSARRWRVRPQPPVPLPRTCKTWSIRPPSLPRLGLPDRRRRESSPQSRRKISRLRPSTSAEPAAPRKRRRRNQLRTRTKGGSGRNTLNPRNVPNRSPQIHRETVERFGSVAATALALGSFTEYFNRQYKARTPSFHPIFLPSS